jgi:hypothetical protein
LVLVLWNWVMEFLRRLVQWGLKFHWLGLRERWEPVLFHLVRGCHLEHQFHWEQGYRLEQQFQRVLDLRDQWVQKLLHWVMGFLLLQEPSERPSLRAPALMYLRRQERWVPWFRWKLQEL